MSEPMTISAIARLAKKNPHVIRGIAMGCDIPWKRIGYADVVEPEGVATILGVVRRNGTRRKVRVPVAH